MTVVNAAYLKSDRRSSFRLKQLGLFCAASLSALCVAAGSAQAAAGPADVDGQRIIDADKEPGNWMSTGRTYDEQRFSPLTQITSDNVGKLGLAWQYKLDFDRGVEATPIVVDGVMYTTGAFAVVYALDGATGKLLWKFDPKEDRAKSGQFCCDAVNRGVAVWKGRVYVGTNDGRLIAIDAKTGQSVWDVDTIADHDRSYAISGAPRIVHGKVIIGNGGAEYGVRGYVTAYDADSGKQAWRFYTVPGDPDKPQETPELQMAVKTWTGKAWFEQGGGGTAWDSMAYDPDLNLLYIGTGNASMWNYKLRSEAKGDNLFLSSIVAINPDTGKYVWHYQTTPGDAWDMTATQHMILADLNINGQNRKVIMQAPKNGFFYVLDRATGKFISAEKYAPVNWASKIDPKTGRPVFTGDASYWEKKGPVLVRPGFWGGHDWQPMSYNPATGLVYIPKHVFAVEYEDTPDYKYIQHKRNFYQLGVGAAAMKDDPADMEKWAKSWTGALLAWDPVHQKKVWEVPYTTIFNGGTLSTAGNLVFEGTADGRVVAYNAKDGTKLWESPAQSGVIAAPVTYEANGAQYVTFMVGWGGAFPTFAGGASLRAGVKPWAQVLTYKLGGTAELAKAEYKALQTPEPPARAGTPEDIAMGKDTFNGHCSQCHGINAVSGGVVPDLRRLSAAQHQMFPMIVQGAYQSLGMPSYKDVLTETQIGQIHDYLIKRAYDLQDELKNGHSIAD
ncbi:PQQ-dependent dehydrogenase, methanol/ethanol family [Acetobacter sp. DsW_063]|uniref:PQQ-dependent dehydrogenase, methanol/ethanol family n=1 Tax=Acetobacter sp. DsW_063 TaxID=1514894 RepID=UPI000A3971FB|nr:PQQ-dependent dehydrogenase, methanol/ethanol family [Acetobacter sp. DsW_063]OUJ11869.1 alcohol dehydrogenase [Acetobacter sp. DsW_063]